jgi:hypothetical protein
MRTRGPRGVDKRVMQVLLDVINDIANILRRNVGIQSTTCGRLVIASSCPGPMVASTSARSSETTRASSSADTPPDASRCSRSTAHDSQVDTPFFTTRWSLQKNPPHRAQRLQPAAVGSRPHAEHLNSNGTENSCWSCHEERSPEQASDASCVQRQDIRGASELNCQCFTPRPTRTPNSVGCGPPQSPSV